MSWMLVPAAGVVLFALAWWTSGRSTKPLPPGMDRARMESEIITRHGPGPDPTGAGTLGGI